MVSRVSVTHSKANICSVEKLIITNLLTVHRQLRVSDFDVRITVLTLNRVS